MELFKIKLSNLEDSDRYIDFKVIAITEGYIERDFGKLYFSEEVLKKYSDTLKGKPVLLEHKQEVNSIIGVVKDSYFDEEKKGIVAQIRISKIGNEKIINLLLLEPRPITDVSIGAEIRKEEVSDNVFLVKEIIFKELSLVFEGADKNAKIILNKEGKMEKEIENLTKENVKLSKEIENLKIELEVAQKEIEQFKQLAEVGKKYKEHLQKEAIKYIKLVEGTESPLLTLLNKADIDTLKEIVEQYKTKAKNDYSPSSIKVNDNQELTVEKLSQMSYKELLNLKSKF